MSEDLRLLCSDPGLVIYVGLLLLERFPKLQILQMTDTSWKAAACKQMLHSEKKKKKKACVMSSVRGRGLMFPLSVCVNLDRKRGNVLFPGAGALAEGTPGRGCGRGARKEQEGVWGGMWL